MIPRGGPGATSDDSPISRKVATIFWCAVLAPPLVVAAFALLLGLGTPGLTTWFWPPPDTNIVEAAWLNDKARVRVLASGPESLNTALPIRPALLENDARSPMTPLEAAVRSESNDMVALVLELGATATPDEARRLQCVAAEIGASRAAELLERAFSVPLAPCDQ